MPIKTPHTKKERQAVVHTEMSKFKKGDLHSGSKDGPKVKSRAQAIAISLNESGQSNKPSGVKTPPPDQPKNPGPYDDEAHKGRSYAKDEADLGAPGKPVGRSEGVEIGPPIQRDRTPHSFDRPSAKPAQGYGHDAVQRRGALRLSGHSGAHHIGKR